MDGVPPLLDGGEAPAADSTTVQQRTKDVTEGLDEIFAIISPKMRRRAMHWLISQPDQALYDRIVIHNVEIALNGNDNWNYQFLHGTIDANEALAAISAQLTAI